MTVAVGVIGFGAMGGMPIAQRLAAGGLRPS